MAIEWNIIEREINVSKLDNTIILNSSPLYITLFKNAIEYIWDKTLVSNDSVLSWVISDRHITTERDELTTQILLIPPNLCEFLEVEVELEWRREVGFSVGL